MKNSIISIQKGLESVEAHLIAEGYTLVPYDRVGLDADVVIISGVDSAYEEIETAQCRLGNNGKEMLLINATGLTPEAVKTFIEKNNCCCG